MAHGDLRRVLDTPPGPRANDAPAPKGQPAESRTTQEVLEDHLELAQANNVETDIARNFDPDCVLMTSFGDFRGHAGVREAAASLAEQIGPAKYVYTNQRWHEELAFLEWKADTDNASISDGVDSYWIRNGRIRAMTIHYSVRAK